MHPHFLQGALEAEALVSEHFITHQPAQPARTTARTASSSRQFGYPALAPIHTLTPFQGSTRLGATPQLGEGEGDGKIKAGQKETRVGPKVLEPAPQLKGQGGGASGATTRGSGRRLFSRTGREATQVSANDLTHCKGGQLKDRAKAGPFPFPEAAPPLQFQTSLQLGYIWIPLWLGLSFPNVS